MSSFASLAPAQGPMAGVPAGVQQPPLPQVVETVKLPRTSRKGSKSEYRLKTNRRGKDDPYLGESEGATQLQNVERIFHWVHRGAATKKQRMVRWGMERIDVDEAHDRMVFHHPGSCAHLSRGCCRPARPCRQDLEKNPSTTFNLPVRMPRPATRSPEFHPTQQYGIQHPLFPEPQASMPVQLGLSSAGHSTGYLQNAAWGIQSPPPQYSGTFGAFPQAPVGMPKHIDSLQGQGLGYQNPRLQDLPVTKPASRLSLGTGHSVESLSADSQQFETALFPPSFFPQDRSLAESFDLFEHGESPPSLLGDSPRGPAPSSSLGTDSTVPETFEGLQEWLDMPVVPQAEDKEFDFSAMGTQFHDKAFQDLPVVDLGMSDGIQEDATEFGAYFDKFLETI